MKIIISLAGPEGNMKQILHSYWLLRQPRWANQVCLMYGADLQSLKFFFNNAGNGATKSGIQKKIKTKEKINSCRFIVLQTQLAVFSCLQNNLVIPDLNKLKYSAIY